RQVPQQLREAGTVRAGQADAGGVQVAGHLSHLPARTPDHGASAKQLVSAGRPQPANIRGHLQGVGCRLPEGDAPRLPHEATAIEGNLAGGAMNPNASWRLSLFYS